MITFHIPNKIMSLLFIKVGQDTADIKEWDEPQLAMMDVSCCCKIVPF